MQNAAQSLVHVQRWEHVASVGWHRTTCLSSRRSTLPIQQHLRRPQSQQARGQQLHWQRCKWQHCWSQCRWSNNDNSCTVRNMKTCCSASSSFSSSASSENQELASLTIAQLKERLRSHGLRVSGKKAELIERLLQHEEEEAGGSSFSAAVTAPPNQAQAGR